MHNWAITCLDACKVNHLLRSTDSYASNDGVMAAENMLLDTFADLLAHPLTPDARCRQAFLWRLAAVDCDARSKFAQRREFQRCAPSMRKEQSR